MNQTDLKNLIKECLAETICELTPEEWKAKSADLASSRPKKLVLSNEEEQMVIQQFRALPPDKKKEYAWCLKRPCTYCEKEFNLPNVGASHGMCLRHKEEVWAQMGKKAPPSGTDKGAFDLKNFTPEEQQFATKLFAVVDKKHGPRFQSSKPQVP